MSVALLLAAILFGGTLVWAALQVMAAGMSDVPGAPSGAGTTLLIGTLASMVLAATHWLPSGLSW